VRFVSMTRSCTGGSYCGKEELGSGSPHASGFVRPEFTFHPKGKKKKFREGGEAWGF